MNTFKKILILSIFSLSLSAQADDHSLSFIQGTEIDLKSKDHGFAGNIGDVLALGSFSHDTHASTLQVLEGTQFINAKFEDTGTGLGGTLEKTVGERIVTSTIKFLRLDPEAKKLYFDLNGTELIVSVTSDDFVNNHFINPTYSAVINGENVNFKLQGEACFGFSAHLSMMIFNSYAFAKME